MYFKLISFPVLVLILSVNLAMLGLNIAVVNYITKNMVWDLDRMRHDYLEGYKGYVMRSCLYGTEYSSGKVSGDPVVDKNQSEHCSLVVDQIEQEVHEDMKKFGKVHKW